MGFPGGGRPGGGAAGSDFVPATGGGAAGGSSSADSMPNWLSSLNEAGCAPVASFVEMGPPMANNPTVGSACGYGRI